jgi:hypothetical protein
MAISAFFILSLKGEVLISRVFRPDVRRSVADVFRVHVIANADVRSPIVTLGSTSFFHVRHQNLYLAAVTKSNVSAALVFEFCYKVIALGRSYFGRLDEESVKNNFALIYELLDGAVVSLTRHAYLMGLPKKSSTLATLKMQRPTRSKCTSLARASSPSRLWYAAKSRHNEC